MVHHTGSTNEGELKLPVTFTLWLPPGVQALRGVIVHQHGCGVTPHGDGAAAACDLHWQALARKHECALLGPEHQQFDRTDCLWWWNPRNGSGTTFLHAIEHLAELSKRPELKTAPWALWGHSGGALWVGTMFFLSFIKNDKGEVTGVIHHTDRAGGWGPPAVGRKVPEPAN